MGRKKRQAEEDAAREEASKKDKKKDRRCADSSDDEPEREPRHYDIDPDIQELAYSFGIDDVLTQRLNDIMIEERQATWEQDIARLYEILKDARTPAAMLNMKLRDIEKGTFVGKAKCGPKVKELARKHKLDKGASTKLEEAMSLREGMGKDVNKDLILLDEHLAASNKPSALVSMKLDSLRKGYSMGHCIYSREAPLPGNQAPGVDGVFDKRGKRALGYSDADLDRRFAEQAAESSGGALMDEAAARRMIAKEREQFEAQQESEGQSRSRKRRSREKRKARSHSPSIRSSRSRSRSRSSCSRSRSRKRRSKSRRSRGRRRSPSRKKGSRKANRD
mmetsp:Transcript_48764/g.106007  ORF Transcript_48764/g.106007 Transcript_48764/m.106007 type:complete len:335 (-) Transcript_48764:44-1048(-)